MHRVICRGLAAAAVAALLPGAEALAHGFAGDRFFPATILTDDPFVADEMSLPTVTLDPTQSDGSREYDLGSDLSMLITPSWDFTLSTDWAHIQHPGRRHADWVPGPDHRHAIPVVHQRAARGHGSRSARRDLGKYRRLRRWARPPLPRCRRPSTLAKALATCPIQLTWLRPFALTGNLSLNFPTETETEGMPNPNSVFYGFAIEYSIPYLAERG